MISYMAWIGPPSNRQVIALDGVDGVVAIPKSGILLTAHNLIAFPAGCGPGPCDTMVVARQGSQAASVLIDAVKAGEVVGITIRGNAGGMAFSGACTHMGQTKDREIFLVEAS